MVISDSTGRSYGRPPGGSLVEGSRNRSRVSRRLSRVFEGRRKCQLHRGGCGLKDVRRGGRTSMEGGRFEVCSTVACKAAKPTTELRRKFQGCDGPRRNGCVCSDASKRWWVPPHRMREGCVVLGLQLILKPKSKLFEELIGDAAIRSTIGAYRGW